MSQSSLWKYIVYIRATKKCCISLESVLRSDCKNEGPSVCNAIGNAV